MLDALNPSDQTFLNNLNRIAARMETAQRRISTGVRLAKVSDDPDPVPTLLAARANLSRTQQIQSNLGRLKAEVDAAEQALQNSVTVLERIRTLGAQAANATQTADSRAAIAQEVGSLLEQLVGLAATQLEGRFVFAGDRDQSQPYTIDLSAPTPLSVYLGGPATRQAQHPNGTTFALAHTAQDIFDSADPEKNVFAAVTALRGAMLADDQEAILAAIEGLTPALAHLNTELAFCGAVQNKVAAAAEFGRSLTLQLQTQISGIEDADLTAEILALTQSQTQQQAALTSRAQMPRATLFDFLG
jgi:flagellar hook-associated protein 3 FlgL